MTLSNLDPRLRLMQQAEMRGKIVLVRVDHNVVKNGVIKDPYRIDATVATLYWIAKSGGRPILMTHIGRPKDKKTGQISCNPGESVEPIARYLQDKLSIGIGIPECPIHPQKGILGLGESITPSIRDLKEGRIEMIYLPNTRWFFGEQSEGPERDAFTKGLAGLADIYINDAFGSWQPHASTYDIAKLLPSYAGLLLQKEIRHLHAVLNSKKPFLGVIAGAKYDTKLGPLRALYEKVDHLILGGLIYNTYLSAKYGLDIAGVSEEDRSLAMELISIDRKERKILEMPSLIEADTLEGKKEGQHRPVDIKELIDRKKSRFLLDVDPRSFDQHHIMEIIHSAKTIFINAVMGMMPSFYEGTETLYRLIASNHTAMKLFGGGDTLQELKRLCPGIYMSGLDAEDYYYFTGGGSVLTSIEQDSPYGLKPVLVLMDAP